MDICYSTAKINWNILLLLALPIAIPDNNVVVFRIYYYYKLCISDNNIVVFRIYHFKMKRESIEF